VPTEALDRDVTRQGATRLRVNKGSSGGEHEYFGANVEQQDFDGSGTGLRHGEHFAPAANQQRRLGQIHPRTLNTRIAPVETGQELSMTGALHAESEKLRMRGDTEQPFERVYRRHFFA